MLYISSYIVIKIRLNMIRSIGFLNFFDPHIKTVQLMLNQILKAIWHWEYGCNSPHKEWEESKTDEFCKDRKYVFILSVTSIISITDSRDDLKYPIKCKYKLCLFWHFIKWISINPWFLTFTLIDGLSDSFIAFFYFDFTRIL